MITISAADRLRLLRDGEEIGLTPYQEAFLLVVGESGADGISRDTVVELLWSRAADDHLRQRLRQQFYELKRSVGSPVVENDGGVIRLAEGVAYGREEGWPPSPKREISQAFGDWVEAISRQQLKEEDRLLEGELEKAWLDGNWDRYVTISILGMTKGAHWIHPQRLSLCAGRTGRRRELLDLGFDCGNPSSRPELESTLVGMSAALSVARESLSTADFGSTVLAIHGPRGSGRSRLMREFLAEAKSERPHRSHLVGFGQPGSESVPLSALTSGLSPRELRDLMEECEDHHSQVLELVLKNGGCLPAGSASVTSVAVDRAVDELLAVKSGTDGLLLAIDDFDEVDPTSWRAALRFLSISAHRPALLIITHTGTEKALRFIARASETVVRLTRVHIDPLSKDHAIRLFNSLTNERLPNHTVSRIISGSGGLPSNIAMLARVWLSGGRDGVFSGKDLIRHSLRCLSPAARSALLRVAVLGRACDPQAIGVNPVTAEELRRSGLVGNSLRVLEPSTYSDDLLACGHKADLQIAAKDIISLSGRGFLSISAAETVRLLQIAGDRITALRVARSESRRLRRSGASREAWELMLPFEKEPRLGDRQRAAIALLALEAGVEVPVASTDATRVSLPTLISRLSRIHWEIENSERSVKELTERLTVLARDAAGAGRIEVALWCDEALAHLLDFTQDLTAFATHLDAVESREARTRRGRVLKELILCRRLAVGQPGKASAHAQAAASFGLIRGSRLTDLVVSRRILVGYHTGRLETSELEPMVAHVLASKRTDSLSFKNLSNLVSWKIAILETEAADDILAIIRERFGDALSLTETTTLHLLCAELAMAIFDFDEAERHLRDAQQGIRGSLRSAYAVSVTACSGLLSLERGMIGKAMQFESQLRELGWTDLRSSGVGAAVELTLRVLAVSEPAAVGKRVTGLFGKKSLAIPARLRAARVGSEIFTKSGRHVDAKTWAGAGQVLAGGLGLNALLDRFAWLERRSRKIIEQPADGRPH